VVIHRRLWLYQTNKHLTTDYHNFILDRQLPERLGYLTGDMLCY